jgi:hypothetical protein
MAHRVRRPQQKSALSAPEPANRSSMPCLSAGASRPRMNPVYPPLARMLAPLPSKLSPVSPYAGRLQAAARSARTDSCPAIALKRTGSHYADTSQSGNQSIRLRSLRTALEYEGRAQGTRPRMHGGKAERLGTDEGRGRQSAGRRRRSRLGQHAVAKKQLSRRLTRMDADSAFSNRRSSAFIRGGNSSRLLTPNPPISIAPATSGRASGGSTAPGARRAHS